jgi:hypothetical protein
MIYEENFLFFFNRASTALGSYLFIYLFFIWCRVCCWLIFKGWTVNLCMDVMPVCPPPHLLLRGATWVHDTTWHTLYTEQEKKQLIYLNCRVGVYWQLAIISPIFQQVLHLQSYLTLTEKATYLSFSPNNTSFSFLYSTRCRNLVLSYKLCPIYLSQQSTWSQILLYCHYI